MNTKKLNILGYEGKLEERFLPLFTGLIHDLKPTEIFVLGKILNNYLYFKNKGTTTKDGFCYILLPFICADTGLSYSKVKKDLNILDKKGYIKTYTVGCPKRKYFKPNIAMFKEQLIIGSELREGRLSAIIQPEKDRIYRDEMMIAMMYDAYEV